MIQKSPQEYKEAYEYHKAQGNADKAKRVADLYRQQLRREQSRERDSAFDFSIDQAQKMYGGFAENIGRLTGSENLQAYGQQVQAQQDKDIARGGYQSKYSTFNDSFDKEGIVGGLKWAIEGVQENFASAGTSLVGAGAVALAAKVGMPAWAVASLGGLTGLNNIALNTGENVLEQKEKVGDFNELKATGAGLIAGFLDTLGASRAIPKSKLNTMTVDEIEKELIKKGHSNAASEFVKRMGAEGLTELSQEAIIMGTTATEGGRYTPAEVRDRLVDSFLLGGATSGAINAPIMTAQSAASLIKPTTKKTDTTEDQLAQASFAKRIATIAAENDYDLKDIKTMSDKGAYRAVDDAHVDLAERLKAKFKVLKEFVAPNKLDTLETLETKIQANAAQRKARNKTKNRVGKADFQAVSDLVGDTFEGQEVLNLMRELNVLTEVHNGGYVGGVSQITDAFNPLPMSSYGYDRGAAATERLIRPMAGLITGVGLGGAVPLTGAGLAAAGRAIDAVTGRRSAVNRFVEQNQANQPLPGPTVPRRESVQERRRQEELDRIAAQEQADLEAQQRAEQQAQAEDDKREANLRRVQEGAPPKLGSPEDIIRDGTGLNRAQIAQVLRILKANPNTLPDTLAAIQKYETSIATGGTVDYDLIRDINLFVDNNGVSLGIIPGPRNANAAQQGARQNLTQKEQNYQRGIEANRNAAGSLSTALNEDRSVSALDKAAIQSALNFVSSSTITQNPVTRMQTELRRLKQQGVSDEAVGKYFAPYVQRVQDQQGASIDIVDAIDDLQESRRPPLTYTPPRKQKSGKYVGAPRGINTPAKLASLRKNVKEIAKKGEYGRFWYERSGQAILDITGGDKADARKLVAAIAITSPQTGVDTNFEFAIQAYYQYKNGEPIQTGIFPTSMGEKLTDVFESDKGFTGRKTGNFENNLLRAIDEQTEQGVTTDLWMMRAFGYPSDAATDLNYDFVENETAKIAQDLGWEPQQVQAAIWVEIKSRMESPEVKQATDKASQRKGYFKFVKDKNGKKVRKWKDLASEQAHGKLWVKKALAYQPTELQRQSAKFDYKDAALNKMALVSVESIPSTSANHLPEIFDAPDAEIIEYHHAMDKAFLDDDGYDIIARQLGMLQMGASVGIGSWEGRNDPVTQNEIVVPRQYRVKEDGVMSEDAKDLIHAYAAAKGILLKQDAIGYHRPFFKNNTKKSQNGIDYDIGRPFTKGEVQRISTLLAPAGIEPIATANGVRFINFDDGAGNFFSGLPNFVTGKNNPDFQSTVISAIEKLELDAGQETGAIKRFVSDNGLIENNWTENKNGEDYLNNDRLRGRPDLQRRVRDIVAELQPRVRQVEEDFSEKYGWSPNAELNTAYDNDPGPDGPPGSRQLEESRSPALLQPEQLQFNFIAPTLREVKQALPEAKEVAKFVVGKKGTKYEEGLRYQDALELAQMLNISVGVYPSLVPFGGKETTIGAYSRKENKIYIKDLTDDPSFPDEYKNITQTQALIHEVSHALESMALPNEQAGSYIAKAAHELSSAFESATIQKNSLREKVRNEILNDTEIKREIELLQDIGFVRTPIGKNATLQEALEYQAYVKSDPEMAVDPVMLYLMFPKILRQEAPKTAKLIRGHFNRASSPINIYANPLATILAILMAGASVALRGPGEDDEEGALNMQRGALSA